MTTKERMSTGLPPVIEWEEASDSVYVRDNLISVTVDGTEYYKYNEHRCSTKEFFNTYFEQLRADIDYISMVQEVNL